MIHFILRSIILVSADVRILVASPSIIRQLGGGEEEEGKEKEVVRKSWEMAEIK